VKRCTAAAVASVDPSSTTMTSTSSTPPAWTLAMASPTTAARL
jgi:hypothetical protein